LDDVGWKEGYVVEEDECDDFELTVKKLQEFLIEHHNFNPLRLGRCNGEWFARVGSFFEGTDKNDLTKAMEMLIKKLEEKK
jgi:hypothetical protein